MAHPGVEAGPPFVVVGRAADDLKVVILVNDLFANRDRVGQPIGNADEIDPDAAAREQATEFPGFEGIRIVRALGIAPLGKILAIGLEGIIAAGAERALRAHTGDIIGGRRLATIAIARAIDVGLLTKRLGLFGERDRAYIGCD